MHIVCIGVDGLCKSGVRERKKQPS